MGLAAAKVTIYVCIIVILSRLGDQYCFFRIALRLFRFVIIILKIHILIGRLQRAIAVLFALGS